MTRQALLGVVLIILLAATWLATAWAGALAPTPTPFVEPPGCWQPPDDYSRLWVNGALLNARTLAMLDHAQALFAAGGGTVIFKGWSTWGYGYTVVIAHGGTLSIYGHLNGAFVGCGETVTAGQNIAVSGNSGRSSGPHLHFEIRGPGGAPVNPWDYQGF